jgi:hypothetical protein
MFETWVRAVRSLICSSAAISLLLLPAPRRRRISSSRAVYLALGRGASIRRESTAARLDVLGAALVALGLGFVTYGIVQAGEEGFAAIAWAFALELESE